MVGVLVQGEDEVGRERLRGPVGEHPDDPQPLLPVTGERHRQGVAHGQASFGGDALGDHDTAPVQGVQASLFHPHLGDPAQGVRVDRGQGAGAALVEPVAEPGGRCRCDLREGGHPLTDLGREPAEHLLAAALHHQWRGDGLTAAGGDGLDGAADDGHEGDQGQGQRQRQGGGRGAAWVAHGAFPGHPAGDTEPVQRAADGAGQPGREGGPEQDHGGEQQGRAGPDQGQGAGEGACQQQGGSGGEPDPPGDQAAAAGRVWCRVGGPHGLYRCDPGGSSSRSERRGDGDEGARGEGDEQGPPGHGQGPGRQGEPGGAGQPAQGVGGADPEDGAGRGAGEPDQDCLTDDGGEHLAGGGSGGAQQGELAGALGEHDAEGVGDEERAHDQAGPGQCEQHDPQVADRLLGGVGAGGGGVLAAGDRVGAADGRGDAGAQVRHGDTVVGDHLDCADPGSQPEQRLRGGQVGQHQGAVGQPVAGTNPGDADDPQLAAAGGRRGEGVADRDLVGAGGGGVQDDLVRPGGGVPGAQRVRGERRGGPGTEQGLGSAVQDLAADPELSGAGGDGANGRDPGGAGNALGQVGGQRVALHLDPHGGVEGGRSPHGQVDPGGGGSELVVQDAAAGVGEHQAAGDEGDPEGDREPGQGQAAAVGQGVGDGQAQHDGHRPVVASRAAMCASTVSAVGASSWSTMRPSARNTTWSAKEAATGSWVTMTMVCP